MTRNEYNGWSNYETWLAALWSDNDGMSEVWREHAESILCTADEDDEGSVNDTRMEAVNELESMIQEHFDAMAEDQATVGFFADLINSALSEIDYRELARHYLPD